MSTALSHCAVNMQMPRANPEQQQQQQILHLPVEVATLTATATATFSARLGEEKTQINTCCRRLFSLCAYVTLVNTKRKCAKCDISHDLCTDNDKSCNCNVNSQSRRSSSNISQAEDHTHCHMVLARGEGQIRLLQEYEILSSRSREQPSICST